MTQKESTLLDDLKTQEKVCAEKYARSANAAVDPQLKALFTELSQNELKHLNMLDQIGEGTVPQIAQGTGQVKSFSATYGAQENADKANDCFLCNDLLAAEKHASNLYDTCIFEFTEKPVRDVLNNIQASEQNHGKQIYDYMSTNSMTC
jgi:rubrerythrin